jgi:CcmD family protein
MKKVTVLLLLVMSFVSAFAQQTQAPVDMAEELHKSGKIYVVVLTIAIIFVGLAIYLFSIDRRLKKIEKEK